MFIEVTLLDNKRCILNPAHIIRIVEGRNVRIETVKGVIEVKEELEVLLSRLHHRV